MTSNSTPINPSNTSVLLLAAGRGKRMRELTETTPKPLLRVGQHSLIEHHLYRLASMGFKQVIINLAYLGEKISATLGDGKQYGLNIRYSDESQSGALETAGGILNALAKIDSDPFITINADIWTDFKFSKLPYPQADACLVLVNNPSHNIDGDFALLDNGWVSLKQDATNPSLTFSGIAVYRKVFFAGIQPGRQALAPLFSQKIEDGRLEAIKHSGEWTDVGTPERLAELNHAQTTLVGTIAGP